MGWYDEAFREGGRARWHERPGQGWWTRPRGGHDWSETQGGGYGVDYRGRGYPYGTGYRPGSEGDFARRAPHTRQFGEDFARSPDYGAEYRREPLRGYRGQRPEHRDEYREPRGSYGSEPHGEYGNESRGGSGHSRGMSDEHVLESVRENLFQDSYIDPERIHVRVHDGVVTLTGFVEDHLEARYAWDDAWESPGVRGVIDRLEVREGAQP